MSEIIKNESPSFSGKGDDGWFSCTSTTHTQRSWPRLLESRAEVPPEFLPSGAFDAQPFPYAVFVPENVVFVNGRAVKTRRKITMLLPDRIAVLEQTRAGIERADHLFDRIQFLKIEDVLLSAVVHLRSSEGSSRVGFNAVRDNLFEPMIGAARRHFNRRANAAGSEAPGALRRQLAAVPGISFKFVNYAVKSLLPGQEIRAVLFRDSTNLRKERRGLFRLIDHFTAPTLLMKTGGELIAIEEPAKMRRRRKMEYGGIFTFVPLDKIKTMTIEGGRPTRLAIGLESGGTVQLLSPDADGLSRFL